MTIGSFAVAVAICALAAAVFISNSEVRPKALVLPPAPKLVGPLAPKPVKGGEKIAEGLVNGPESIVYEKGVLYTCVGNGRCVKIENGKIVKSVPLTQYKDCNGQSSTIAYCGRPLGIRRWTKEKFLVADAILGIVAVDFEKGKSEILYSAQNKVGGLTQKLPDDLDVYDNDTIFYSDASTRWSMTDGMLMLLENAQDGRIIELKLSTGEARVLVDGLSLPNGVQIHPDRHSLLIAESVSAKIQRFYFAGPKKGRREVFCADLPGFPDNIRLAATRKSFFVALFASRFSGNLSVYDYLAPKIWLRKLIGVALPYLPERLAQRLFHPANAYGIIVELDLNGNIIDSYHDPRGELIRSTTEVVDDGGKYLYLASFSNNHIGRILKH